MIPYRIYFIPGCVSEYMRHKLCPFRQKPFQVDTHKELAIAEEGDYATPERRCRAPPVRRLYILLIFKLTHFEFSAEFIVYSSLYDGRFYKRKEPARWHAKHSANRGSSPLLVPS